MGEKAKTLIANKNDAAASGDATSTIAFINARRKPSASKL
jgi:hypothetical protein